jgi:hypothetical protein
MWKMQLGDLLMTRHPCPPGPFDTDMTNVFYDPEQAFEAYQETDAIQETRHAAQLAAYIRLQRFFFGYYNFGKSNPDGKWLSFQQEDLSRAQALFAAAGWSEARSRQAVIEAGEYWAERTKNSPDYAEPIRQWLNDYKRAS